MDDPHEVPANPHILILTEGDSQQEFHLTGGPLEKLTGDRAVMAHIGRAVLAWARMEQHLTLLIMTINRERNSPALYEPKHPHGFTEQIRVASAWFSGHPALVEWKDDFAQLVTHLEELADARHTLAHSVLDALDTQTRRAVFKSVKRKRKGSFELHRKDISFNVFPRMTIAANAANTFLSVLTHKLCCPEGEEVLRWRAGQNSPA